MNQPLVEDKTDIAKLANELREMADRMEKNQDGDFGGCFVIIPPQGGDVLKTLILDSTEDPAQFWALVKTKAQMAEDYFRDLERQQSGFRR